MRTRDDLDPGEAAEADGVGLLARMMARRGFEASAESPQKRIAETIEPRRAEDEGMVSLREDAGEMRI
jgi:hypothetical protein